MRLIGTIDNEKNARIFSAFLKRQGIEHQIEIKTDTDWGSPNYGTSQCRIWINEEDQVPEALKWYDFFLIHPEDALFSIPKPQIPIVQETSEPPAAVPQMQKDKSFKVQTWDKQPMGWVTRLLIVVCAGLLLFSDLLTPQIAPNIKNNLVSLYTSPIEKALLFDYPYRYELIDRYLTLYGAENSNQALPAESQALLNKINQTPVWQGLYPLFVSKEKSSVKAEIAATPMFEKIHEGQVWRLFSPALLHADIFHLFFNMLWLIVLGKQIEQRLSSWRYIIFILIIGIFSNTAQYLMSGPNFIGFSGVLCGMLTFVWARQTHAPWEGYQLNRMTYLFMLVFILGLAAIQLLSFFIEKSLSFAFSPNIANVAHLSGAFMGYLLGRTQIFNWRHS